MSSTGRRVRSGSAFRVGASTEPLEPRRLLAAGLLDPTFGNAGRVELDFRSQWSAGWIGKASAVGNGGEIVVVGHGADFLSLQLPGFVAMLRPNGALDPAFGQSGVASLAVPDRAVTFAEAAIQPDGKIVAVGRLRGRGSWMGNENDVLVARFNPDGTPDLGFDGDGILTVHRGVNDWANTLLLRPDGSILVAGQLDSSVGVVKLLPDGSLDRSFGGGTGAVRLHILNEWVSSVVDVVERSDGTLLLLANWEGDRDRPQIIALKPDGTLEDSFGVAGRLDLSPLLPRGSLSSLVMLPDGRMILGAGYDDPTTRLFNDCVLQLTPAGAPDTSFSDDGLVSFGPGVRAVPARIAFDPLRSRIFALHVEATSTGNYAETLYCLNNVGQVDTSYFGGALPRPPAELPPTRSFADLLGQPDGSPIVSVAAVSQDAKVMHFARLNAADTTPPLASIDAVDAVEYPAAIRSITFRFDEAIQRLDLPDLKLTRDADDADLLAGGGATMARLSDRVFRLDLPAHLAARSGRYTLSLRSGVYVLDLAGNRAANGPVGSILAFRRGDLNGDGIVDNGDIAPFVTGLTQPGSFAAAFPFVSATLSGDVNADGAFNNADIAPLVALLTGATPVASKPTARPSPSGSAGGLVRPARALVFADPPILTSRQDDPPAADEVYQPIGRMRR